MLALTASVGLASARQNRQWRRRDDGWPLELGRANHVATRSPTASTAGRIVSAVSCGPLGSPSQSIVASGALMRITKVIVERASCASEGFSVLADQAPAAPPSSGPPGKTVLAP